ncbi:MAG TPA: A/G-specific adenine glycosylase, partial [Devosia sp.]|nr:A/G-specific adenine glycosylase [Devosia sp.]
WAGLGYYVRARNLHACAQQINRDFSGIFPQSAKELAQLPGIGPYTAAAIAAICFDEKIAVVDSNVERVVARFCALEKPVRQARPQIREYLQVQVPGRAGDFAQGLMDLGASVCTPRIANCNVCPLGRGCTARAIGSPLRFPLKAAKKTRPARFGHAFVLRRDDGAVWLCKRPEKGLLARMSEVPGSEWRAQLPEVEFPAAGEWALAGRITHAFSHFRLELNVWQLSISDAKPSMNGWWCPPDSLAEEALPSVFRKVLAAAGLP